MDFCHLIHWTLWSIYNKALILLSWAFIIIHLEIFNPLSQAWAYNVFITFGLLILFYHFLFLKYPFSQNILQPFSQSPLSSLHFGPRNTTMETDCVDYVKRCHDYQTRVNLNHVPPSELYNMTSPWPFLVWGINVIGRTTPKPSNGHEYILVTIDYFTKQVEAVSYSVLKAKHVARFLENNIICWFGVPHEIIFDNSSNFGVKFRESWKNIALSIISLHHIDLKLIGPQKQLIRI